MYTAYRVISIIHEQGEMIINDFQTRDAAEKCVAEYPVVAGERLVIREVSRTF